MKSPNSLDIVLGLIKLHGDEFIGKTNLHKNIYLIGCLLKKKQINLPVTFRAYYYGPFSRDVSNALGLLVDAGLVEISERSFKAKDHFELKQAVLKITPAGDMAADKSIKDYSEFFEAFEGEFNRIVNTGAHQNTKIMATAAKIRFILEDECKPLNKDAILNKAKDLDWKLNESLIAKSANLLIDIGLAKEHSS